MYKRQLLLFNPLQIDASFEGAAAISMKSPVEIGKDHGVFLNDGTDHVQKFLHKQTVETLTDMGAVNAEGNVDLDTGAVLCGAEMLEALFSLISENGEIQEEKYAQFVNEKSRISFYGDFLYPLAKDSTLEQFYEEQPEGSFCEELHDCRTKIWEVLHQFPMKLICLSPAEFIHFGTTRELRQLLTEEISDYEFLDWKPVVCANRANRAIEGAALHKALLEEAVTIEEGCYIENSMLKGNTIVHQGAVVSNLCLEEVEVPENTVCLLYTSYDRRYEKPTTETEELPDLTQYQKKEEPSDEEVEEELEDKLNESEEQIQETSKKKIGNTMKLDEALKSLLNIKLKGEAGEETSEEAEVEEEEDLTELESEIEEIESVADLGFAEKVAEEKKKETIVVDPDLEELRPGPELDEEVIEEDAESEEVAESDVSESVFEETEEAVSYTHLYPDN